MTRDRHIPTLELARAATARGRCVWAMARWRSLIAMALAAVVLGGAFAASLPSPAAAISGKNKGPILPKIQKPDSSQPMLLQADEMIYDNQDNRVTARGNVEIYYGTYTLLADQVTYDRGSNTLIAEGNVSIKEPDGAVINADQITLTDDFRDGFLASLKMVTKDDSRITAKRAIRERGDVTIFEHGAFTPCKPCKDNPNKPPTWQVKAVKVIHKKTEATITYRNATFELFGWPIAWLPYFKHADPSVKRKSGFLIPSITHSNELGQVVEIPYYFALAPNYDFTFSPTYTERHGILYKGKWRHRTAHGRYDIEFAAIDQENSSDAFPGNDGFRGTIKTTGKFAINKYWEWGWDITAETDDTFRRYYGIDGILTTDRVSDVHIIGQRGRNFFSAYLYNFGGLLASDTATSESWVHPVVDYNYVFANPVLGGELSFDANVMSLSRDEGTDSARLITQVKWRRMMIDRLGQVYTPFFVARGDYYHVSNVVDPITGIESDDQNITRGVGVAGLEYRYPFVTRMKNAAHVIEPVAQIIARPGIRDQNDVPNEDARSFVYDDTLLFDIDKFSGYDRIEGGTRANIGLRYTLQQYDGGYIRAVVGQSLQLLGSNEFPADSGLATSQSDYVIGVYVQPVNYFTFISQNRFDEDTLALRRTDLVGGVQYGPFSTSLIYANLKAQPGLGIDKDRQEIQSNSSVKVTENWSVFGKVRYDIERDQRITDSIGVKYSDDCFALQVSYSESFIRDRDIEPDQRVMLRFQLKYLGAFNVDAGNFGG